MDSLNLEVLKCARDWFDGGHAVTLVSVIETWGSAPRPPGSLLAIRGDGCVSGSVSGGCIEDDLIRRVRNGERVSQASTLLYGVTREEASRFGLPCGGTLRLLQEPLRDSGWITALLARIADHELVARTLHIASGNISLHAARRGDALRFDGSSLTTIFGPHWRLLLIGAGQLSRIVSLMAVPLGFDVLICDPRLAYRAEWDVPQARFVEGMPDDVVLDIQADAHTAIVALTHDPKLDDMALLEALKSPAFYIGALGSRRNTQKRRERLAGFDLSQTEIDRLHGPVGLYLGSRTPAEIAISILAEIVAVKNGIAIRQTVPELAAQGEASACSTSNG